MVDNKKKFILLFFLILVILYAYAFFSTNVHFSYAQDALEFSYWVENSIVTKINRHFLWNIIFFWFYKLWDSLGLTGGALKAGQILSAFFGAGGVILFYYILRQLFLNRRDFFLGLIFSGFFAFSFAYWHFSGEANPQVFSNFLRLLLLFLIIKNKKQFSIKYLFFYGAVFSLVLLSELLGFYLFPTYLILIYFFTPKGYNKFKLIIFVITSIALFSIFYAILSSALLDFIPSIFWRAPNITDFFKESPLGILYLLLTMIFIPGLHSPYIGGPEVIDFKNIITPFNIIFILFLFVSIILCLKYLKKFSREERGLVYGCMFWIVILFGVQIYREPRALANLFYILSPIWILVFVAWKKFINGLTFKKAHLVVIFLIVFLCFHIGYNFVFGINKNSKDNGYEMLGCFDRIEDIVPSKKTIILISNSGNYELYEIHYLLKYESNKRLSAILLDGYEFRPSLKGDIRFYDKYKTLISKKNRDGIYMFIIPKLPFLSKEGCVKDLTDVIRQTIFNTESPHTKYSLEIIKQVSNIYSRYLILEDGEFNFTLIKLTS